MKSYEELRGAEGRRVFFRAERFPARTLFPRWAPVARLDGHRCTLLDLSITGLAVRVSETEPEQDRLSLETGDRVTVSFEIEEGAIPLQTIRAEVRRIDPGHGRERVALCFTESPLDVPALVRRHGETILKRELEDGLRHGIALVDPDYRRHCADVLHMIRGYRATLRQFESTSRHEGETPDPDRLEKLYSLCEARILPEWASLRRAGNRLTRPLVKDAEALAATKLFTERVLTPDFLVGPIWNRSYRKPFGYPGDFEVMNYAYEARPRGATLYERLVHRLGLDSIACVTTRMLHVRGLIADRVASHPADRAPCRVMSLGCGPAREVQDYLQAPALPCPVVFTLVDQDERALTQAYESSYPRILHHGNGSQLHCLQTSFVELLRADRTFAALPPQDLIYSVGLFDYLSQARCGALAASLYAMLAPGGSLVIANVADVEDSGFWASEFICDWTMVFRSREDMTELGHAIPGARVSLDCDETGQVLILTLTRPDSPALPC